MQKKTKFIVAGIFVLILGLSLYVFSLALNTYVGTNKEEVTILTVDGTIKETLKDLEKEGVIKNSGIAYSYVRFFRKDAQFLRGTFEIPAGLDLDQVIDFLGDMDNLNFDNVNVRFIEGETCKTFAKKISAVTSVSYEDLVDYWDNDETVLKYAEEYPFLTEDCLGENIKHNFEGYLFPDTYNFYVYTNVDDVTRTILDRTLEIYNKHIDEFNASEFSVHEIFTLASIVQYESGYTKDMPTIAGIFVNRLKDTTGDYAGLQSSVTVCYILEQTSDYVDWKACETASNLEINDPYNTYRVSGLTPGPIDNPGESAIEAVLNYEDTDYFFFIGDNEGNTYYARTYAEHVANCDRYINWNN